MPIEEVVHDLRVVVEEPTFGGLRTALTLAFNKGVPGDAQASVHTLFVTAAEGRTTVKNISLSFYWKEDVSGGQ